MAWRQPSSHIPYFDAEPLSSSHNHSQTPSQHASEGSHRRRGRTEQTSGHPDSDREFSTDFQGWQSESVPFSNSQSQQAGGQWAQQWQQQQAWGFFNPAYRQSAAFSQLTLPEHVGSERQTWQQQYPQYSHINPAFLPQQTVAIAQHTADTTSRYRRLDASAGTAYDARQQPGYYGTNSWSYQVPVANSQAQTTRDQQQNYRNHHYGNTLSQFRHQAEPTSNYASGASGYNITATSHFPKEERYGNRVSQNEGLVNPTFMRSSRLMPPGENPRLYLLPHPKPTTSYLEQANLPPRRLSSPKKLLVVLDLNGTLLLRSNRGSNYTPRPHVPEFLTYCLEHHALIIWSSARPHNVKAMVAQLFTPEQHAKLVKIWSREHLRLGKHFEAKVQVYKQLPWLWEDAEVQASFPTTADQPFRVEDGWKEAPPAKWDQSNTVLLDDSSTLR